jgi:hypothetical protein
MFCRAGSQRTGIELYLLIGITALALNPMTTTTAPAAAIPGIILLYLVALFLTVATLWIFWYAIQKLSPNEIDPQFYLVLILVIIPFAMLIYFGLAVIIYDAISVGAGWARALPL